MKNAEYLGDGAYVHQSEYGEVVITTGHHDPREAKNVIVLGIDELSKLTAWLKKVLESE